VQTGLRIGEAIELRWSDVDLGKRTIKVSRRVYRGRVGAPKSRFGRRTVKIPAEIAQPLWKRWADEQPDPDALIFTGASKTRVDASNLMSRVLKPAAVTARLGEWIETGTSRRAETWVGFHTFRHTCATMLFRAGNAVQVQRFLGHHKPSFTLDTYVHLLDEDIPEPPIMGAKEGNAGATEGPEIDRNDVATGDAELRMAEPESLAAVRAV
jgi:integrase